VPVTIVLKCGAVQGCAYSGGVWPLVTSALLAKQPAHCELIWVWLTSTSMARATNPGQLTSSLVFAESGARLTEAPGLLC
jgi:hypothetical protein